MKNNKNKRLKNNNNNNIISRHLSIQVFLNTINQGFFKPKYEMVYE